MSTACMSCGCGFPKAKSVGARLHHRDVVGLALRRLEKELTGAEREEILRELEQDLRKSY